MRIPLAARLTIYAITSLVVVVVATLVYDHLSHPRLLLEVGTADAESYATTLVEELTASMRAGGGRAEHDEVIRAFSVNSGIKSLKVVQVAPMLAPAVGADRQGDVHPIEVATESSLARGPDGSLELGYRTAVRANEACTGCHISEVGSAIGIVDIRLDLEGYEAMTSHHESVFIIWSAVVLSFTIAVLALGVRDRVQKPLEKLERAAEHLASGDLGHRVRLDTGDEFERVGYSLDEMAAGLQSMTSSLSSLSERYLTLVEMAPDAMLLVDASTGFITDVNPAALALTGYDRDALKGLGVEKLLDDEYRADYAAALSSWVEQGKGYLHDVTLQRCDGRTVDVDIGASTVEIGGAVHIQQVWRDLSDRKRYERARRRYVNMLEDTVRERTEHLKRSLIELKQSEQRLVESAKLASLGEMCAGIAHELNSPMAGILSITEVLKSRLSGDERTTELLEKLMDAVIRSKKIILDMLAYSRGTAPELAPVDLNDVVTSTITVFRSTLKLHSIEIIEEFTPGLPLVLGDKGRLMEVALNLLKNASDAAGDGGWIRIKTGVAEAGRSVVVEVADSGPGITEDIRHKVFDPFFTTKEKGGGLNVGLGLSISATIVKEHGGVIDVGNSGDGLGGAVFRVIIPGATETVSAGAAASKNLT